MLKTFTAFIVTNRSHTVDLTPRLLTTFKANTRYSSQNLLSKSVLISQFTAASTSTSKQTNLSQFYHRSDHPVSATVPCDIKMSLASWIASSGRPIPIVEDDGNQHVLRTVLQDAEYKLPGWRTIDKMFTGMYNSNIGGVKDAV